MADRALFCASTDVAFAVLLMVSTTDLNLAALVCAGVAAGFGAPISGVFFAVESVLQLQRGGGAAARNDPDVPPGAAAGPEADPSGLTVAGVLLARLALPAI